MSNTNPHEGLLKSVHQKHYPGLDYEKFKAKAMQNQSMFEGALKTYHKDNFSNMDYNAFSEKYYSNYGSPFQKKKRTPSILPLLATIGGRLTRLRNWLQGITLLPK